METDSTASSASAEQTEQAGRERKASVEMNVVDVGDVAPSEKKKAGGRASQITLEMKKRCIQMQRFSVPGVFRKICTQATALFADL